ncbi:MAG: bactofilin family protein [Desulfobacterales bacterium]
MSQPKQLSIIDEGLRVEGSVSFAGSLLVRGLLKGKLDGDAVTIAEEGEIAAEATVKSMTVGGRFTGDLRALESLVILPTGNCEGSIECRQLVVQEGGRLNARIQFLEGAVSSMEKTP